MKVLSLFDGISAGRLALERAGIGERLQTFPDNYTAGVSNTQRYKMLGNSWTVDVVVHIFRELIGNDY